MRRPALVRRAALAALLVAGGCGGDSPSALDPHGSGASHIADAWWLVFGIAVVVYVVVAGFILAAMRRRAEPDAEPSSIVERGFIWIGGIIVPTAVLAVVAVVTVTTTDRLLERRDDAVHIAVTGHRWWWEVRYPDDDVVTANEIHVPVGQPVRLELESADVAHSFWVPQLAGKVDTIPGQPNTLAFTAEDAGTYRGECAEFCGIQHAHMGFTVVADAPRDFDRWLAARTDPPRPPGDATAAARGRDVFEEQACAGCHTIRGTSADGEVGPDLTDFGSRRWIGGTTVRNTTGNLSGWISNSQTIEPGNLMPPISLEPDELTALVAYLQDLRP